MTLLYISLKRRALYCDISTFGLVAVDNVDTGAISAAMICKLLKQWYCDAGCFPKNLTQSIYWSVYDSI